jgi:hypothetical protein
MYQLMEAGEGNVGGESVTVYVWQWSYSLICVHNDPIVSLHKPVTLLNGKHKKICTVSSTEAEFLDVIGAKFSRIFQGYSLVTSTS